MAVTDADWEVDPITKFQRRQPKTWLSLLFLFCGYRVAEGSPESGGGVGHPRLGNAQWPRAQYTGPRNMGLQGGSPWPRSQKFGRRSRFFQKKVPKRGQIFGRVFLYFNLRSIYTRKYLNNRKLMFGQRVSLLYCMKVMKKAKIKSYFFPQ